MFEPIRLMQGMDKKGAVNEEYLQTLNNYKDFVLGFLAGSMGSNSDSSEQVISKMCQNNLEATVESLFSILVKNPSSVSYPVELFQSS
jgi:hypothetical protein